MEAPSLRSLEGLTDAGLRGGAEMRSALLGVLTDLYVQKLTHTLDEERHYTELALRLIDSVDATTRAAVAAQLGKHLSPPRQVIERLAEDLLELAGAPRSSSPLLAARGTAPLLAESFPDQADKARGREDLAATTAQTVTGPAPKTSAATDANVADELNEIFFAANAHERRLILLNLDVVVPLAAERPRIASDPSIGQRLEAAALARKRQDFVQELGQSLKISREQARRIVDDELGEPIVIAAKALSIRRDLLYRILLFVNTAVGHSVERVHALAQLYDEITLHAAQDLVAIWQALGDGGPSAGTHQPLLARDKPGPQFAPTLKRTPLPRRNERREAS
jgi:hypothetical protein